jgi:exosortase/archaeosortase family protein
MRVALLAAAVPIAILANSVRVAAAGSWPSLEAGVPHAATGWLIFVICLATLMLLRQLFNRLYVRYES